MTVSLEIFEHSLQYYKCHIKESREGREGGLIPPVVTADQAVYPGGQTNGYSQIIL